MTRRGWLLFAAMAIIWGIPYLFIKIAVGELTPTALVFFRTGLSTILLLPLVMATTGFRPLLPYWRWVLAYTIVEVSAPWFFLADAERRLPSSLTGLLIAAVPLIGALLTWLTRGDDRLDIRRVGGLALGLFGVAVLVGLDVSVRDLGAVGEVLLVAVGYATGPIIVSRCLPNVPSMPVVTASLGLTAIGYAPIALRQLPTTVPSPQVLLAVGVLAVVCTALAFLLFFALIGEVGPVRATVITYFNPAVALLLGVLLLREPFTIGAVIGFALILAGSLLATRRASGPAAAAVASSSSASSGPSAAPGRSGPLPRSQGSGR